MNCINTLSPLQHCFSYINILSKHFYYKISLSISLLSFVEQEENPFQKNSFTEVVNMLRIRLNRLNTT